MINTEKHIIQSHYLNIIGVDKGLGKPIQVEFPSNASPISISLYNSQVIRISYIYKQNLIQTNKVRKLLVISENQEFFPDRFAYFDSINTEFGIKHIFFEPEFLMGDFDDENKLSEYS